MSTVANGMSERLAALRDAFDRSFAEPPAQRVVEFEDLLAIRMRGQRYALHLAQTSGLFPVRPITPLPGPVPALLGVAGFGGSIVPVYELGLILGFPAAQAPRWLVLTRGDPMVALAFSHLDGYLRVPMDTLVRDGDGHDARRCLRGLVPLPDGNRHLVDLPAVVAAIHVLIGHSSESGSGT